MNASVLWVVAVVLAIIGVFQLLQGQVIFGIVVLVVAAGVGPGGWSFFRSR
ncbi:MAG: GPGG-motif small membrane protein [Acidimicrobiales bacterium]